MQQPSHSYVINYQFVCRGSSIIGDVSNEMLPIFYQNFACRYVRICYTHNGFHRLKMQPATKTYYIHNVIITFYFSKSNHCCSANWALKFYE